MRFALQEYDPKVLMGAPATYALLVPLQLSIFLISQSSPWERALPMRFALHR
jgi:hypothetical protein